MLDLRRLTNADTNVLFNFEKGIFSDCYSFYSCNQELLNPNKEYYILSENEQDIGYVGLLKILDEAEILRIAIKKDMQDKGYGKNLLNLVVEQLKSQGINKIYLEVSEKNSTAIKLYETLGFVRVGKRKDYYKDGATAINMERRL